MSKLIAVQRTDINGHLVTRWVRPEEDSSPTSAIPGPSVSSTAAGHRIGRRLRESVQKQYIAIPSTVNYNDIERTLLSLPAATVDLIEDTMNESEDEMYTSAVLISALHNNLSSKVIDDIFHIYSSLNAEEHDNLSLFSSWDNEKFDGAEIIRLFLAGFERTPVPGFDYDYAGRKPLRMQGDYASKALAVFNVSGILEEEFTGSHVKSEPGKASWLTDVELVALIVKHHDRVYEIIDIMRERETTDPEAIAVVLDNEQHALKDGAL